MRKKGIAILLISTLAISMMFAGGAKEAAPAARDSVNLCVSEGLITTDGQGTNNLQAKYVLTQMYEGLYYFNEAKGELEPRLATGYSVSDDGTVYTFNLRDDAYFHNGDKVTAKDVAFSFNRALTMPNISSFASMINSARAIDELTVEVLMDAPYAPFMINLCHIFIMSEREVLAQGKDFGTKVTTAGTGPYKMTQLDSSSNWTLEAFDKYYRGEAPIKYIKYAVMPDAASQQMAFESGELDWFISDTTMFQIYEKNPKYETESMMANHCTWLAINPDANAPLANDKVRKAIAYAIDKEANNIAAFDGLAGIADYLEHPDYNLGAPYAEVVYNYDPAKAKALLAEAGYPNGVDIGTFIYANSIYYPKMAPVIQDNLAAVGITCKMQSGNSASLLVQARAQEFDIYLCGASSYGDYDNIRRRFYTSLTGAYFVKYKGDKFDWQTMDRLMDESCAALDNDERLVLTNELNDMLMETATYIPILHKAQPYVWVKGLNVINRKRSINPAYY